MKNRKIMGYRGCKNNGAIEINSWFDCGDKECGGCTMQREAMKKVIEEEFKTFKVNYNPLDLPNLKNYKSVSLEELIKAIKEYFNNED